jgi:PAS domain S-box-containing protein
MGGRRREKDLESRLEEAKAVIAALISGWEESLTRTAAAPRLVREAHAALAGSKARFRALVENTSDVIALLGPEGHVSYVSPAITTMLGHRPTDLTGKPGLAFLHPVDRKRMRKLFARSIWEGAVLLRDEVRARHADGSWRNLELSIVSWLEDASVDAIVVTLRDITDRKQSESTVRPLAAIVDPPTTPSSERL